MLRVPENHPGRKQRGRACCAISSLSIPSSFASVSLVRMLSPTIPVHPRNAPVSPIIPVHTQKQGGGGPLRKSASPAALLFSMATLTTQLSAIVGAPTFPSLRPTWRPICGRPLKQNGITSSDLRRGDLNEALFLCNGKGARKVLAGDVTLGFRKEEIGPRFERGSDSRKEGRARGNFVHHSEQQSEINGPGERLETRRVLGTKARVDLRGDSCFLCALFEPRKHLLLHVDADDFSRGPHHLCQWNAEKAHRASEIQHGHSFLHVGSEDGARIVL